MRNGPCGLKSLAGLGLGRLNLALGVSFVKRLIAEWLAGGQAPVSRVRQTIHAAQADSTVNDLALEHLRWADVNYRKPSGEPAKEPQCLRLALRPLIRLFGSSAAVAFGPLSFRAVREAMIAGGLARAALGHDSPGTADIDVEWDERVACAVALTVDKMVGPVAHTIVGCTERLLQVGTMAVAKLPATRDGAGPR